MKWRIDGTDRETGLETSVVIEAASREAAQARAYEQGIVPDKVAKVPAPPAPGPDPPKPPEPPGYVMQLREGESVGVFSDVVAWLFGFAGVLVIVGGCATATEGELVTSPTTGAVVACCGFLLIIAAQLSVGLAKLERILSELRYHSKQRETLSRE